MLLSKQVIARDLLLQRCVVKLAWLMPCGRNSETRCKSLFRAYQKEGSFGHFEPPFRSRCSLVIGHVRIQVLHAIFSLILTHRHSHHYSRITVLTRDYYY